VRLYEKRHEYTRTRMVQLAPYLVADSVESYRTDYIDGDSVEAVLRSGRTRRRPRLRTVDSRGPDGASSRLDIGFCSLNSIERAVSDLIDARVSNGVQRTAAVVTVEDAVAMLEPGDILIDCTGARSPAPRSPAASALCRARRRSPARSGPCLPRSTAAIGHVTIT
jgi:hypothetical protein